MERRELVSTGMYTQKQAVNMEQCAEFMARMIQKYGAEILEELESDGIQDFDEKHKTIFTGVIRAVAFSVRYSFQGETLCVLRVGGMPDSDILIIHGEPCNSEQPKEVRM